MTFMDLAILMAIGVIFSLIMGPLLARFLIPHDPPERPGCFGSQPGYQARAENDCDCCPWDDACRIEGKVKRMRT